MNHHINLKQYLERLPNGYIARKQELIAEIEAMATAAAGTQTPSTGTGLSKESIDSIPVEAGPGNKRLQQELNRQGV
jgi:hypothetical protein